LEFKRGITSDPAGILATWQLAGGQLDCCRWRGVRCSNSTGHVVGLNLRYVPVNNIIALSDLLVGQISPSLLSLHHLKHLDLSWNNLQGPSGRLPEFLGSLKSLRYLNLSGIPFQGRVPPQLGNLTNLHSLDLSCINICGLMSSTDISWLTRMPSLRFLNMKSVNLSMVLDLPRVVNMIPSLMVLYLTSCNLMMANQSLPHLNLTKLERLDLSYNDFIHPVTSCWFWNLTSLQYLNVGGNYWYSQFPEALGGMTSLQVLDFSDNSAIGNPQSMYITTVNMTKLCNLEILHLDESYIDGNITELFQGFPQCPLNKLKELYLNDNNFTGMLPGWIGRWTNLLTLDLSNNQITGEVPSEIGTLTNLTDLYLDGNNFTGLVTHELLSGLKSLTELDLSGNSLKIVVDPEWLPPFRLQYASFSSCEMGPQFPSWLQSQVDILELHISGVAIFDTLPDWFCTTFSNAWKLNMPNNGINGTLPTNMEVMTSLERLHLNSNQLTGHIPKLPGGLSTLDISWNSLSGSLPSNFPLGISDLRLFSNFISGHIPESMCQLQNLQIIDLANNILEGGLPHCFQSEFLEMIIIGNNKSSGRFPSCLQQQTNIYILDLERNNFIGELPVWIGDMGNIEILRLGYNDFSGSIPATITNLTKLLHLDLAANRMSGVLPWHLSNLRGMRGSGNTTVFGKYVPILNLSVSTKGHARYYEEGEIFDMVTIDLSSNFLTGGIPKEIIFLDRVVNFNLSWNLLSGSIPMKIGAMQTLESLDLSRNKLYGEIPQNLTNLTYLSYLDLSHNNLTRMIPSGGQLDTLYAQNPFMYDDNIGLCGHPLHKNCSEKSEPKHGDNKRDELDSILMSFPFGLAIGYVVGLWSVFCAILFKKSWTIAYFRLFDKVLDKVYVFVVVTWARWAQKAGTN
ncbi:hypothetical protein EJB05_57917, partial [Eragrostis curvula]